MALNEGLVLNGLNLNSGPEPSGAYTLEAADFTPPKKKPEWAQGADSDGALLLRTPLFDNRTVTAKVRIEPQSSMNGALEKLGAIVDQLQEAEKNPAGIPLVWTPAQSTKSITFYVLTGEVTGLPVQVEGNEAGWFVKAPIITITMTCKPYGYGEEEEVRSPVANESGLSVAILTLANIKGDVPAEGRLVVKDTAAVGRRYVEWGLESRYYNSATKLVIDSEDLIPVAGAQSTTLNASAYKRAGASKGTIATTLLPDTAICCTTGNLGHVGTFRIKIRGELIPGTEGTEENAYLRLSYTDGEGPLRANEWANPTISGKFAEFDLGVITITPALAGTQKWLGQIEAYSTNAPAADILHIDYLELIPVLEGYGKARGVAPTVGASVVAFDNFTTGTKSGNLNGRAAPQGGKWATSGSTTDLAIVEEEARRETTSDIGPRYAILGPELVDMCVTVHCGYSTPGSSRAVIVRWASASNYAALVITDEHTATKLQLVKVVSGTPTTLAEKPLSGAWPGEFVVTARSDGTFSAVAYSDEALDAEITLSDPALATGGSLASGVAGYYDYNPTAIPYVRALRLFKVESLPAVPYCIHPSELLQIRSDGTITTDSTGTYYGSVPEYRGSRFFIPQAGEASRTSRILVKADRNDLEESDQQIIGDAFTAQVFATPRYHVIPR